MRRTLATLGILGAFALISAPAAAADPEDKIAICHATGSDDNPFTSATVSLNALNGHENHGADIIPPNSVLPEGLNYDATGKALLANGCVTPGGPDRPENDQEKVEICHATGSASNPYVRITISVNGLNGHGDHEGDIIPPNSFLPAGLNFDAAGQATYNNGCVAVENQEQFPEESAPAVPAPERGGQMGTGAAASGEANQPVQAAAVAGQLNQQGQWGQQGQWNQAAEQSGSLAGAVNPGFNVQTAASAPAPVLLWGVIASASIAVLWAVRRSVAAS